MPYSEEQILKFKEMSKVLRKYNEDIRNGGSIYPKPPYTREEVAEWSGWREEELDKGIQEALKNHPCR